MERFDDKLKRMAQEEDFPLPDWAEACTRELVILCSWFTGRFPLLITRVLMTRS